ncbi:MAG: RNA polymerase sigma factor [Polyangiales bacterium]
MSFEVPRQRDEARALDDGARPRREPELPQDGPLLKRLRGGDEQAFLELVRAHHAGLVRVAFGYARRPDLAESLARDAWTAFLEGLPRLDARVGSVRAYLFRALIALARARSRKLRRPLHAQLPQLPVEPLDAPLPPRRFVPDGEVWAGHWTRPPRPVALDDAPHGGKARALLLAALDALPEREREVLVLCDVETLTPGEVALALGASEASVCVALDRARARLREQLEAEG